MLRQMFCILFLVLLATPVNSLGYECPCNETFGAHSCITEQYSNVPGYQGCFMSGICSSGEHCVNVVQEDGEYSSSCQPGPCATCGYCNSIGQCALRPYGYPCRRTDYAYGICDGLNIEDSDCLACNSDCTTTPLGGTKGTVCTSKCNGINSCTFTTGCNGAQAGSSICVDSDSDGTADSIAACCSGTLTSCGTQWINCKDTCDYNTLIKNAQSSASCKNSCAVILSNPQCSRCIPKCETTQVDCGVASYCLTDTCKACLSGRANCDRDPDNGCEVSLNDSQNCGSCGNVCSSGQTCCSGVCVNTLSNNSNCGGCGATCSGMNYTACSQACTPGIIGCTPKIEGFALVNPLYSSTSCSKSCVNGNCYCMTPSCEYDSTTCVPCGKNETCQSPFCNQTGQRCVYTLTSACYITCLPNPIRCGYCIPTCTSSCSSCPPGQICQNGACVQKVGCTSDNECPGQKCCSNICTTPLCNSSADCNDVDACTTDACSNPATCNAQCTHITITSCAGGDGCCPAGCNYATDADCSQKCNDGNCDSGEDCSSCPQDCKCGDGKLCCSGVCKTPACSSDAQCDDGDASTKDSCTDPGSCAATCSHTSTTLCGNGKCDTVEWENYCNCPQDCTAQATLGDVPGEVCKQYSCSGTTRVETAKPNCCGNNECESITGEGCGTCPHDCSCPVSQMCRNNRCSYENLLENGAECTSTSQCKSDYCGNGYCCAAGNCCIKKTDCLEGQVCSNFSCQFPNIKCNDATVGGQCSKNRPMYCNNGILVTACATCGCQEGSICTLNGICNIPQCSDGTYFSNCSANKPNMCKEGMLVSSCFKCGCPEGLLCDNTSQTCYEKPVIRVLSPLENGTINIGVERSVVISGVILKSTKVSLSIEGNDSKFMLTRYNASTGEFSFENSTPVSEGPSSLAIRVADSAGNLLSNESRHFRVINAPAGMTDLASLQGIGWYVVQFALIAFFAVILINMVRPVLAEMRRGSVSFPDGAIILVEGAVGSGKEELCLQAVRGYVSREKFGVVFSYEPEKVEGWFRNSEKSKLIFVKVEPDINTIAWSISRAMTAAPSEAFFDVLNMLTPKYNTEELTDFLSTNFSKLRNAKCGAMFCIDKGTDEKTLSAIEGLFDGVVEFQLQEEKGKLSSHFRVKEFKLKKMDTNWRRFK